MVFSFGKKKDPVFDSAQRVDNYQKAQITHGDLYGMRAKNLDAPPSPMPSAPSAPMPSGVAPPIPEAPSRNEFSPAPVPESVQMGPSSYDINSNYSEAPAPIPTAPLPPAPAMPSAPAMSPEPEPSHEEQMEMLTEDIEKIAEAMINQKLQGAEEVISKLQELQGLHSEVETLKNMYTALNEKVDGLQRSIVGKVDEYNKSINDVNAELAAVGKVFEKLIPEFTKDVRELQGIVNKKRGRKKKKTDETI